jgi:hypothetical protein
VSAQAKSLAADILLVFLQIEKMGLRDIKNSAAPRKVERRSVMLANELSRRLYKVKPENLVVVCDEPHSFDFEQFAHLVRNRFVWLMIAWPLYNRQAVLSQVLSRPVLVRTADLSELSIVL